MRFCIVTTFCPPYHFGGAAIFVQALARGLANKQKGQKLYLDGAHVSHSNFEIPSSFVAVRFLRARVFGAARVKGASILTKLLYVGATPLIPVVRFRRLSKQLRPAWKQLNLPKGVTPILLCGLVISAIGELVGCCLGPGYAKEKRALLEFNRPPHRARNTPRQNLA